MYLSKPGERRDGFMPFPRHEFNIYIYIYIYMYTYT